MQAGGDAAVEAGQAVVTQTITLEPGSAILWRPSDAVVIVKSGTVRNYKNCTEKETWEPGKAYLLLQPDGTNLTKNEGGESAQLVGVFTKVPAGQAAGSVPFTVTDVPAGCAAGTGKVAVTEFGRGAAYGSGAFTVRPGTQLVVQHVIVEPGFTTTWHRHPDNELVIQVNGTLVNYQDCTTKEVWMPGNAYIHLPSEHHGARPFLTRNESNEPAEIVTIFFNVPNEPRYPAGMTPITPFQQPPADCPTMLF